MKKLRNSIVRLFVVSFLLSSIILSVIDSFFTRYSESISSESNMILALILYPVLEGLVVILVSFLFYFGVTKRIKEESERNVKRQSFLFANISHDLKTPLTSIVGFSKAIQQELVTDSEDIKRLTGIIYKKAIYANELLELQFQYSKLNSSDFELQMKNNDVASLLRESLAENYDLIEERKIQLTVEIPSKPFIQKCDDVEMKRVFNNLISNACKHNPEGTHILVEVLEGKDLGGKVVDTGVSVVTAENADEFK